MARHIHKHAVLLIARSGGGKRTVSQRAIEAGYTHIETSALLLAEENDVHSHQKMAVGVLIDDDRIITLIKKNFPDGLPDRVVLDGLRSIKQLHFVFKLLSHHHVTGVHLDVSKEEALERLRVAKRGRKDDTDENARVRRVNEFDRYGPAMIRYINRRVQLVKIDGELYPEEVADQFCEKVLGTSLPSRGNPPQRSFGEREEIFA